MTGLATAGETVMVQYVGEDRSDDKMKGEYVVGNG